MRARQAGIAAPFYPNKYFEETFSLLTYVPR